MSESNDTTATMAGRLAEHTAQTTGLRFSDVQLHRSLHREGFSYLRPKHTLKGKRDPAAYECARRQLSRLKKGRRSPGLVKF